jgi:Tetraspanin family.
MNVFTALELLFSTFILLHVYFLQSFGTCTEVPGNIFTEGCLDVTEKFVKDHAAIIGGAGIGVACLMVTITIK